MALDGVRRFMARISFRLLAFNVLLVFFPAAASSYLTIYERQLLQAQEESMVQQGRLLAAALSERGPLEPPLVEPILVRLEQQTTSRIRVLDGQGWLVSDTSRLGPLRADAGDGEEPEEAAAESDLRASWLYRVGSSVGRLLSRPRPSVSEGYYAADTPFDGVEILQALAGEYGAATRITSGGQRSVTLYSALPIRNEGEVVGVVLVSQSTFQILQSLYEVRLAVLRFLAGAVVVAAVLSLLVSTTISRPIKRLRAQAVAILDRRGRLKGRFRGSDRLDEIGDLSRALSELSNRLEERMRFIESFSADVSHEFKNPLTSIRAAAETMKDLSDERERERFASMIAVDIARLERLLTDVREVTLLDATEDHEGEQSAVVVNEILKGVTSQERFADAGARVRVQLAVPDEAVMVTGQPDRYARVFENLIDNAAGFSPPGGRISVTLESQNGSAVVRVEDEGPGVPREHHDRIFERFFSYRPNDAGSKEHSGLGLAIAKTILERYGGSLRLIPSKLGGAGFEVSVPTTRSA
jgi:two-component system sensor histidine kinase ChvG